MLFRHCATKLAMLALAEIDLGALTPAQREAAVQAIAALERLRTENEALAEEKVCLAAENQTLVEEKTCLAGEIYARSGLDLDRLTLASWVGKASFHLRPVADRLARHLKTSSKLFMDETRAPVLDPGRGRTKTGWLWALARDDRPWSGPDPPGVIYFYAPGRGGEHAEEFLDGFDGILRSTAMPVTIG